MSEMARAQRAEFQTLAQEDFQISKIHRLCKKMISASAHGFHSGRNVAYTGNHNNRDIGADLADFVDPIQAISVRKTQVQQNCVKSLRGRSRTGVGQITRLNDHKTFLGQILAERKPDCRFVINEKNLRSHSETSLCLTEFLKLIS